MIRYIYSRPAVSARGASSALTNQLWTIGIAFCAILGLFLVCTSLINSLPPLPPPLQKKDVPFVSITVPMSRVRPQNFRLTERPIPQFIPTKYRRKRLSKRQKEKVLRYYEFKCASCRRELEDFDTEFDHIIPLAADPFGRHQSEIGSIWNYQPLCRRCHGYRTFHQRKQGLFQRPRTV